VGRIRLALVIASLRSAAAPITGGGYAKLDVIDSRSESACCVQTVGIPHVLHAVSLHLPQTCSAALAAGGAVAVVLPGIKHTHTHTQDISREKMVSRSTARGQKRKPFACRGNRERHGVPVSSGIESAGDNHLPRSDPARLCCLPSSLLPALHPRPHRRRLAVCLACACPVACPGTLAGCR